MLRVPIFPFRISVILLAHTYVEATAFHTIRLQAVLPLFDSKLVVENLVEFCQDSAMKLVPYAFLLLPSTFTPVVMLSENGCLSFCGHVCFCTVNLDFLQALRLALLHACHIRVLNAFT